MRMRGDSYYVYIRGSLFWVACGVVVFSDASIETYVPVWTWHIVG